MWKKIKEILCKHTVYKDETTLASVTSTMTASVIDLRPSTTTLSQRTETLHHHHYQPYHKLGSHTLNKTNEHCRSLFNLLPTSLRPRPRHHRQASNKKGVDASTTTQLSPSVDIIATDYDSTSMSQSLLNRTPSYTSCYSAITTTVPSSSFIRYGSIENLLHDHSKSNPANLKVIIRKNFEPFAQAHIAVTKGAIVTALFSRGPWLYIRIDSNGKTGYIPRIICSLMKTNNLSQSSTNSSLNKDNELDLTKMSLKPEQYFLHSSKQPINRYLSHSSAIINDPKQRILKNHFYEHDRRNTYTLPRQPRSKERRLTVNSTLITNIIPTRDTDSSSTQDSGYSESTPFFLVQQVTPDKEQASLNTATSHYTTLQRSSLLKIPDSINPSQRHTQQQKLINDILMNDNTKRHSFGTFDTNINNSTNTIRRLPEFALIRNVRQDKVQQKLKPSINNLPKSHVQIPASVFLNHHRQKQQFGSSHSAFRPVQPSIKHKRASSEGHSPSTSASSSSSSSSSSSPSSSLSSSNSSLNIKRRRLSCDLPIPILSKHNFNSLTRSVCDQRSPKKLNCFSRTMSDILCDQFSEINLDAIEKDSLVHQQQQHPKKLNYSQHCLFTIIKDYRSSRASFSVKRGDHVYVLKQVGRACYLVRKHNNGQIGFLPKALLIPTTTNRVDTFLETHGYRETII